MSFQIFLNILKHSGWPTGEKKNHDKWIKIRLIKYFATAGGSFIVFAVFWKLFGSLTQRKNMSHQNKGRLGMWVLPIVAHGQVKELLSELKRLRKTVLHCAPGAKVTSRV